MPAKPNANKTELVKYRPTTQVAEALDYLIRNGFHGNSRAEVVNSLVLAQMLTLRKDGELPRAAGQGNLDEDAAKGSNRKSQSGK